MRHLSKKPTLDRKAAPRKAMINQLMTAAIVYEKIITTEAKAKAIRPILEKLITKGKKDTLANRRIALATLQTKKSVQKLFDVVGKRYQDRNGGYTRITKLGVRGGDGASMAQIELVN
jgi:large subunit ribosomal protein L17